MIRSFIDRAYLSFKAIRMNISALRSFGLFLMSGGSMIHAQPIVDVTLVEVAEDTLEVRVRPDGDLGAGGWFSTLTFTIRWELVSDAHLGQLDQLGYGPPYCALNSAPAAANGDGEIDTMGFRYATFNAFGLAPLHPLCWWTAYTEVPCMRIPVTSYVGCANFQIVNDAYTAGTNKDLYISLNGLERTGVVYGPGAELIGNCSVSMAEEGRGALQVFPNPVAEELSIRAGNGDPFAWTIADGTGRSLRSGSSASGSLRLDVTDLSEGLFLLETVQGGRAIQQRFVVVR